ncbi:transposase [Ruminococcus sp.]|uniref:transposase n=1 Tax=Ruminococcus sp. TaxID=41978 RepID=UPI00345C9A92
MDRPIRKEHRLSGYDYSRNGAYFVTICTHNKQHYFWDYSKPVGGDAHIAPPINDISTSLPYELSEIGQIVRKYIVSINGIIKYVIMPDHIHIILRIENNYVPNNGAMWASPPTRSLPKLIRSFKILVTKESGFSPWQRNYYDHIIRNDKELAAIWDYIENNPLNWENDELFCKE